MAWRGRLAGTALVLAAVAAVVVVLVVAAMLVAPERVRPAPAARPTVTGRPAPATTLPTPAPTPTPTPTPAPTTAPTPITIALAGDVHFTGRTAGLLDDPDTALGPIAATLGAADLAMLNLETAITERGTEQPKRYHFRAPPSALKALAAAGVDVATMANNHAVDYGPVGLDDTLAAVAAGPIPVVGIGRDAAQAYAPYRTEVRGTAISIFAALTIREETWTHWTATDTAPGVASTRDTDRLLAGVRAAAAAGDVVVVYLHWGVEDNGCPDAAMATLAADLAAAGATAVVGAHAHQLVGAGYLDRPGSTTFVSYGLGDFVWYNNTPASDATGVLTLTIAGGIVTGSVLTPALIDEAGRPQPVSGPQLPDRLASFDRLRSCAGLRATPRP